MATFDLRKKKERRSYHYKTSKIYKGCKREIAELEQKVKESYSLSEDE